MRPNPPNPENGSFADLDEALGTSPFQSEQKRFLAIKMRLAGIDNEAICKVLSVTLRSVQLWIRLWNERGIDALKTKAPPGASPKIAKSLHPLLCEILREPEEYGETHWTIVKLRGVLREQIQLECGYSTLTRFFRNHGFVRKMPRNQPYPQDEEDRQAFREAIIAKLSDPSLKVWFGDETGITADPRPRKRWALKGERIRILTSGSHLRENVIGAVQPHSGRFFALQVPEVDSDIFQVWLDEFARETKGENTLLVLDNARWHKVDSLNWHHIEPLYLPPYSPDLNPVERLWLYLKEHYFNNWHTQKYTELKERVTWALRDLIDQPEIVNSVTKRM